MCLAVPGKVLSVTGEDPLERSARVSFGGVIREVQLACVPDAVAGDYVLVHVGLAIGKVDEAEANRVWQDLKQMDEWENNEDGSGKS